MPPWGERARRLPGYLLIAALDRLNGTAHPDGGLIIATALSSSNQTATAASSDTQQGGTSFAALAQPPGFSYNRHDSP